MTGSLYSNIDPKYENNKKVKPIASDNDETRKYTEEINVNILEDGTVQSKRKKRAVDPTKRICELYMQADHKFYEKYGSDVDTVIEKLTQHVQAVDEMYKDINFDGSGGADNIGFIIKKIKVWDDKEVEGYKYDGNFDVDYFLNLHSQDNYDSFCLSYMFTNQDFSDGVLGLAWVGHPTSAGGVCETFKTYSGGEDLGLNTGIVTLLNYGSHVPFAVSQVTFAHEIGHNFGSEHDPESNSQCTPGETAGNYIMYARATSGTQENNFKLSSCSIDQIMPVLEAKAIGTDGCFVEFKGEVCGNRVVEGTEECDCGWDDECTEGCCNPMVDNPDAPGVETPCTRKSSAVCSPSEGTCCDDSCQHKNNSVVCRSASDCLDEAVCTGTLATCPASGHKPNATTCGSSDDSLVCYNGECSGSVCLAHGREPCYCSPDSSDDWKDKKLCQVCCMDGDTCKSSFDLDDVPDADSLAGQPCNNYEGYCDVFKICRQVSPEGPLSNLKKLFLSGDAINAVKDFLTKHWYIGLIFGFVFIVSIALVVKFCSKTHRPAERDIDGHLNTRRAYDRTLKPNQVIACVRNNTVCESRNQDQIRDTEVPNDGNATANSVFVTELDRQNSRSKTLLCSSSSRQETQNTANGQFTSFSMKEAPCKTIPSSAILKCQNNMIRKYISLQQNRNNGLPLSPAQERPCNVMLEYNSQQGKRANNALTKFENIEGLSTVIPRYPSDRHGTKVEEAPYNNMNKAIPDLQRKEEANDGMQIDDLLSHRKLPTTKYRGMNDVNKQQHGKVKTIIVYTKRKGQTDLPSVIKSPEIQRPI